MYGFEAINEAMGWQMTALGISIVFLSLIVLAIVISQMKKVLDFIEKLVNPEQQEKKTYGRPATVGIQAESHPKICPDDMKEVASIWSPLVKQLNEPFKLRQLHQLAEENDFPHPHLTINRLRTEGILVPGPEEGTFFWKHD